MFKCPDCQTEFHKLISLSIHYRSTHKKTAKELFVVLRCDGIEPTCKCGCGGIVKYLSIEAGFADYIRGHAARVNNNWGHNKTAMAKSLETRQTMLETGDWKPFVSLTTGEHWGKGLTKETDPRIAKMSESLKNNPIEVAKRAKRMSQNRKNGTIPTLIGNKHSQWKRGISSLRSIAYVRLYTDWKKPKLEKACFKCEMCGCGSKLEVHHNQESFASILNHLAKINKWDTATWKVDPKWIDDTEYQELKIEIANKVADYHIKNNISGIVLCEACHKDQHVKLNF